MCLAAISRIVEHFHTGAFRIGLATGKDECVRANQIASFIARRRRRLIACLPPPSKGAGNQSNIWSMILECDITIAMNIWVEVENQEQATCCNVDITV